MAETAIVHHHGGHSTPADHSPIQKWINRLMNVKHSSGAHVHHGAHAFRQYAEAGLVGGVLAAVDQHKPEMSDRVQLATAGLGFVGAIVGATSDVATDLRNVGSDAFAIFTFRKGKEMMAKKALAAHGDEGEMHGEAEMGDEDPIVRAAEQFL